MTDDAPTTSTDGPGRRRTTTRLRRPAGRRRAPADRAPATPRRRSGGGVAGAAASCWAWPSSLLLLLGACGVWVQRQIDPSGSPGRGRARSRSPRAPARRPSATCSPTRGSSRARFVWDWYLRINGGGPFQAGDYQLAEDSSMGDVVDTLVGRARCRPRSGATRCPRASPSSEIVARLADPEQGPRLRRRRAAASCSTAARCAPPTSRRTSPRTRGSCSPTPTASTRRRRRSQVLQQMVAELDATMAALAGRVGPGALQPHALRDPDRRLAHRGGDEGPRGAAEGRPRDLQPPAAGHPARHRRHVALRGRARGPGPRRHRLHERARRTTPAACRACRRRRSRRPAGPASRRRCTRPTGRGSTTSSRTPQGHHFFTDSDSEFLAAKQPLRATPGSAAGDRRRGRG